MALTLMSWNIENLGADKAILSFARFVATVMKNNFVVLAAFQELRNTQAKAFGKMVAKELSSMVDWYYVCSDQYGTRLEQYLWVYREEIKETAVKDTWLVPDGKGGTKVLGFPRLKGTDRPPHMVVYDFPSKTAIPLAVFHAPSPNDPNRFDACRNLAAISDFADPSKPAAVLGDFNINPSCPKQDPGKRAFEPVQAIKLMWQIKNGDIGVHTSLQIVPAPPKPQSMEEVWSAQYDNVFGRLEAQFSNGGVLNLLEDCLPSSPTYDKEVDEALRKYIYERRGKTPPGGMVTAYSNLREAFVDFRTYVSDHMPILADVSWG